MVGEGGLGGAGRVVQSALAWLPLPGWNCGSEGVEADKVQAGIELWD